jgi:hypothetical protein
LPDVLKLLVFKRYDAWADSTKYHNLQHDAKTDEERFLAAKNTVEAIQENWKIWDELNHWHKYKKVLGKHPKFKENEFLDYIAELERKPQAECIKELFIIRRRARNNINTLLRKGEDITPENERLVEIWIEKHNIVSEKLNEPKWTN